MIDEDGYPGGGSQFWRSSPFVSQRGELACVPPGQVYLSCLYFGFLMVTGGGEPETDMHSNASTEQIVYIIVLILTQCINAFVMATFTTILLTGAPGELTLARTLSSPWTMPSLVSRPTYTTPDHHADHRVSTERLVIYAARRQDRLPNEHGCSQPLHEQPRLTHRRSDASQIARVLPPESPSAGLATQLISITHMWTLAHRLTGHLCACGPHTFTWLLRVSALYEV